MNEQIPVAVVGARGRMGSKAVDAVMASADMRLVDAIDIGDPISSLEESKARVAIDFTVPAATEGNVHELIDLGVSVVVGTTGWDEAALGRVREHLSRASGIGVLIAPNFAIGAILATNLAARAAPFFETVEVIELHHPDKLDAPSGTARATAHVIAKARSEAGVKVRPDVTDPERSLDGARGAVVDQVHVHSVRLRGLVAHEEILLGNPGEYLTIRHDSLSRVGFMPGVLAAVRHVVNHPGLTVGLEPLLGLA